MSVLIKGMDMPKSCFHCYFCNFGQCKLNPNITVIKNWLDKTLYKKCPLVGVPTPHGRLIDENELLRHKYGFSQTARTIIKNTDAVIEAEVSE